MKLTTTTTVSVDGVMQGAGGADEDRSGSFERGGWSKPGVGELKATDGGELLVPGSGALVRWLLAEGLVDEMTLVICPVVVGQGTRLFPDAGPDVALELLGSWSTTKGVTIQTYRPSGRPTDDMPAPDLVEEPSPR